jgi:DNA-binding transcriptional LysR family regulator
MEPPNLLDGRLKLRHLVLIDALADRGTVIGAAEQLHITQPVATRALRELEEIVGTRLFDRGPRGVTLTVFGAAFVDRAQAVLAELRAAGRDIGELADADRGMVMVGTYLAGSNLLLPRAIMALKAAHPYLTVEVREATPDVLVADLLSGRIDLIVGRLTPMPGEQRIAQTALHEEPIQLVTRVGHPAHELRAPRLADLMSFPWVLPVSATALRHELEAHFQREELPLPRNRIECTSILTLVQLLVETDVIATLPELIIDHDDRLAALATPLESLTRTVGITHLVERTLSPSAQALFEQLQAVAAGLPVVSPQR